MMPHYGTRIYRERIAKNWSQRGLSRGICTPAYLSKIENGRAEPSEEVLRLLLERLGLSYDPVLEAEAEKFVENGYDLLFAGFFDELRELLRDSADRFESTACAMEISLFSAFLNGTEADADESGMSDRALAIFRCLQDRAEEALRICPNGLFHMEAGIAAYMRGDYSKAVSRLSAGYELAAREGAAHIMLRCKLFIGNCFCNRGDLQSMNEHYAAARRLAKALGDKAYLSDIEYNTAAAKIETGQYEDAYVYFSSIENPGMMKLHKLAICCEKTGRTAEAYAVLDRAERMECEYPETELVRKMLALVRMRLDDPHYTANTKYGELLCEVFKECRKELPVGYAEFHLPWMTEWHTANRQYKEAFNLLQMFPEKTGSMQI